MAAWTRICCAVDFSESSRFALLEAADLARRHEADLTLLHVFEPPAALAGDTLVAPPELFEASAVEMDRKLEGWRAEAERVAGRRVFSMVRTGNPASEIVHFARERFVDLVVMGTHGRTGIRHLVLGSVAERVVRQADCSVLVARRTAAVEAD